MPNDPRWPLTERGYGHMAQDSAKPYQSRHLRDEEFGDLLFAAIMQHDEEVREDHDLLDEEEEGWQ